MKEDKFNMEKVVLDTVMSLLYITLGKNKVKCYAPDVLFLSLLQRKCKQAISHNSILACFQITMQNRMGSRLSQKKK